MLSLPIAYREMLVQAKSPVMHKGRVKGSVVLLLLGIGFATLYRYAGIVAVRQIVQSFSFMAMMICAFGGVSVTSDCISREKRDGTLGLLFLTPLKPVEIALGKLIASGLGFLYALLMALPLFSLVVIAGGIAWTEVLGVAAVALNIMFASLAIGLYASTISLERKKASSRAVWLVMFFWWMLPLAAQLLTRFNLPTGLIWLMRMFSFSPLWGAPAVLRGAAFSGWNFLGVHLVGWFFVAASIFFLPRRWQDHPHKRKLSWSERWKQISYGKGEKRQQLRQKLMLRAPFLWLAARDRSRRWHAWGMTCVLLLLLVGILPKGPNLLNSFIITALSIAVVLQLIWTGTATYQLELEREQGTMEMLLSTPLRPEDIMRGQWLALIRHFRGPIAFITCSQWALAAYVTFAPHLNSTPRAVGLVIFLVSLVFLLNFYALHHAGLWCAVTVRQQKQAAGAALMQCLFLPLFVIGISMAVLGLLKWTFGFGWQPSPPLLFAFWFALQLGIDIFWIVVTRRSLPVKMRSWAMQRYSPEPEKPDWFDRLRRLIRWRTEKFRTISNSLLT